MTEHPRLNFRVTPEMAAAIDEHRRRRGHLGTSEAIRELIATGLEQHTPEPWPMNARQAAQEAAP